MKRYLNTSWLGLLLMLASFSAQAQTTFYHLDTVQKIEMFFHETNWDRILDSLKLGDLGYHKADSVKINGINFPSTGVKYKGNSSYDSAYVKNPFTIKLDKYVNQNYQGIKSIKLANMFDDPSMIREVLAYKILSRYMHCSRSNFAEVWINGNRIGLYSNDEDVTKTFVLSHFYSSSNTFIKCSPLFAAPAIKANLKYIDTAVSSYNTAYEMESSGGASDWQNLIGLCSLVTYQPSKIDSILDIDRALWMLAFDNALVNMDSYMGVFAQNYFLYKDNTGHYNPIVWDLNMAFGGFNFAGSPSNGMGTMTKNDMVQLSPTLHATHTDWPLITAVQSNPTWKRMYMAHLRTIIKENFKSGYYDTLAAQLQATAAPFVQQDNNKFFTTADFTNGMTADVTINGRTVPGIKNLMDARVSFLSAESNYNQIAPHFYSITANNYAPDSGDVVNIRAMVSAAQSVTLGYRCDSTLKFSKLSMYDDGMHGDSLAGDLIYGASITLTAPFAQYYLYAESNDAGKFAPERAEHEYYRLPGSVPIMSSISNVAKNESNFVLFPNPASQQITLQQKGHKRAEATLLITDLLGKKHLEQPITMPQNISVAALPPGVYFVHLISSYGHEVMQLLKQ